MTAVRKILSRIGILGTLVVSMGHQEKEGGKGVSHVNMGWSCSCPHKVPQVEWCVHTKWIMSIVRKDSKDKFSSIGDQWSPLTLTNGVLGSYTKEQGISMKWNRKISRTCCFIKKIARTEKIIQYASAV